MTDVLELSKKLHDQISNVKFDMELFENTYKQLSDILKPIDVDINDLTIKLNKLNAIKDQVVKYRDDTRNKIVEEVDKINKIMKNITDNEIKEPSDHACQESPDSDDESEESETWLTIAKHGKVVEEPFREHGITHKSKKYDTIKITPKTSIDAYVYTANTVLNAPPGHLVWLVDKGQFAMKIIIGDKPIIFEGNIGNIYVRSDTVSNVDLCRQSQIGRSCLKSECTFRHEPPKKGEIRNFFSAPTYYPPRMGALAKDHKGVHRIGSRENLDDDLCRIRTRESSYEYNAYISQAFHTLLVALVMERGTSS